MPSRNIKLILEYDGARYFGFQRQKDRPTVQAALEAALSKLFNRPMKIAAAAGRTDAGAHAAGQVVNFKVDSALSPGKIQAALNAFLPKDIAVKRAEEVPAKFHARYGAKWKTYEYRVLNSKVRSPLLNGWAWRYPHPLNRSRMKQAARLLTGRHDFKAFQAAGSSARGSVRRVRRFNLYKEENLLRFVIEADGFLYHMVRSLVGTLLKIGRGNLSLNDLRQLLRKRGRRLAGPTAPAAGLTLLSVTYRRGQAFLAPRDQRPVPFRPVPYCKFGPLLIFSPPLL